MDIKVLITDSNERVLIAALNAIGVAIPERHFEPPCYIYVTKGKEWSWSNVAYGDDKYSDIPRFEWEKDDE